MTAPVAGRRNATDRILRAFAVFTSLGYLFYLLLLLPAIIGQAGHFTPWWTPLAAVAVFGTGFAFGLSTLLPDTRSLRIGGAVAAGTYLAALAAALAEWRGPLLEDPQGVWLTTFPGVASLAVVAALRPLLAFGYMAVACTGAQILNHLARDPAVANPLLPDLTFAIMFCTLFVAAAVMALRTGRILDATVESTHAAAAAAAASHARTVERARFDALIHDGVMSTLLLASRTGGTEHLAVQAGRTLDQLDALRTGPGPDERFDAAGLVSHLRTAAAAVDDDVPLAVRRLPGADAFSMPAEAARAVGAALAEALRNCDRHAGPDAHRSLAVTLDADRVAVEIADTGIGFDPDTVPAHRLGVTVSIVGRMQQLPGGSARIDSRPGEGTHVHLGWVAP